MIKYELFNRLNTGGSIATPQEVRNCILLMLNRDLYDLLRSLANQENFKACIALSDKLYEEQYDMELVLPFILLFERDDTNLNGLGDVSVFLSDKMREMAIQELNLSRMERAFERTFDILSQTSGSDSFRRYRAQNDRFLGGFLLSAYEVVVLGIGYNYENLPPINEISDQIKSVWSNETYNNCSGAGVNASRRLPYLIPLGRTIFSNNV
jgi:hypothetical protein